MKIEVNGSEVFSNYPQSDTPVEEQEDYRGLTLDQRKEHLKDETLLSLRLDDYVLPSLLQKLFKSM